MQNFNSRTLLAAVGVVAVAIIIIVAMVLPDQQIQVSDTGNQPTKPEVVKKEIEPTKLPDKFPSDFPVENGAPILDNNVQTSADGRFQATRSFETSKSLAANLQIYSDYFKNNGWTIGDTINQDVYKAIGATKGTLSARVSMNDNSLTKKKTIDIYISQVIGSPTPSANSSR
jgi:hypothetical protein